ncbi:glycosyltransferase [Azospirillum sp.]|uniref:glycosyltransferase n=1 Tax=Azospirillum sp. TaxID=34012 RepID=UPI002D70E026|nr:glycosyltransferase [Azospirillum sp.]HYD64526.1 glycosyltransferase [Azospirillum sp.]
MKVAVVTPYYRESPDILRRAHDSVAGQTHSCRHVMVADGFARAEIDGWDVEHIRLPQAHGDNGNTPRHIGAAWARDNGFDAVAFLDADNWYEPGHIAGLVALHGATGAPVVSARRRIWSLAGAVLLAEGEAADGAGHADTSTLMVTRDAFDLLDLWAAMPRVFSPLCDTIFFYAALFRGHRHAWTPAVTLNFQSHYKDHYFRALVPAPHDNGVENAFYAAYGAFIRAPAEEMARVFLAAPDLPADLPQRFAAFGAELAARDKSGDGLKYLERAAELLPLDPAPANDLGAALARRGRHAEAVPPLRRALDRASGFAPALHNLGLVMVMQGDGRAGAALLAEAAAGLERLPVRRLAYGFVVVAG